MLEGRPVDHVPFMPITMMFAADMIGVKYGKYAFDHDLLVEGQLRTAEEFGIDFVSCISDPGREAADCGAVLELFEDQPPALGATRSLLADKADLAKLGLPDPLGGARMYDRVLAAAALDERVGEELLVEGWVEGPCAEGADLRGLDRLMIDFFDDEDFVRDLFEFALEMALRFARAQVEAGADLIGVGDAAASLVGPRVYREFVWPYEKRLLEGLHDMGAKARLHICGNITSLLADIGKLGFDIVDLDSMVDPALAREAMGPGQVLLGNLDPVRTVRNGTPASIVRALEECHAKAGARYIVGGGCEIPRDTAHDNLRAMGEYARTHP